MTPHEQRPLLFLDVDGTLLPFGDHTQREPPGAAADSHLERLNPQLGLRLAALPCELIWTTTWDEQANTEIAPRIGLPSLPVVNWPEPSTEHEHEDQWFGLHWKTRTIGLRVVGGRTTIHLGRR
jgi:Swiss Army Knife RNA repair-like protein